jgi:hypothetical protein
MKEFQRTEPAWRLLASTIWTPFGVLPHGASQRRQFGVRPRQQQHRGTGIDMTSVI